MPKLCGNVYQYDRQRLKRLYQFPYLEDWTEKWKTKTDVDITGSIFYVNRSGSYRCIDLSYMLALADYYVNNGENIIFKFTNFINIGEITKLDITYDIGSIYGVLGDTILPKDVRFTIYDNATNFDSPPVVLGNKLYEAVVDYSDYGNPDVAADVRFHHYIDNTPFFYQDVSGLNSLYFKIENMGADPGKTFLAPYCTVNFIGIGTVNWCYVNSGFSGTYVHS